MMSKWVVIAGGGSRGSGGAGKLARLDLDFDKGVGTSTGSLMLVPVLMKRHDLNYEAYTTSEHKNVLDSPKWLMMNKKDHIRKMWILYRILFGYATLTTSNNLRKSIAKYLTFGLFTELRKSGKEAIVTVHNLKERRLEYKSSNDYEYEDFLDWTWISACQPPVMSIVSKNLIGYVDGGVMEVFPMSYAVERGAKNITGVIHAPKGVPLPNPEDKGETKNLIHHGARLMDAQRMEILRDDIRNGIKDAEKHKVKYDLHYIPYGWGENDLAFNKEKMKKRWDSAYSENII